MGMKASSFQIKKMRHRLLFSSSICKAEWNSLFTVKKMTLFEQREFVVFRKKESGMREINSYRS